MTDERQQTHWQDCYKDRHHHACALVEIDRLRAEVQHWKANHDNRVEAARVLIERNDLPFDRVPAYKHYLHLQEDVAALRAENESLRKDAERGRHVLKYGAWYRDDEEQRTMLKVLVPYGSDLSCYATRENAIDAAIREQKP